MSNVDESDGGTDYADGYEGSIQTGVFGKGSGDHGRAETSARWDSSGGDVGSIDWYLLWETTDEVHEDDQGVARNNFSGNDVYLKTFYKQHFESAIYPDYYDIYHRHKIWGKPNGAMRWYARAFTRNAGDESPGVNIYVGSHY
jgi:hypothetical protein